MKLQGKLAVADDHFAEMKLFEPGKGGCFHGEGKPMGGFPGGAPDGENRPPEPPQN